MVFASLHPVGLTQHGKNLQCVLWVGVGYRVADRRDSRGYADREVAGNTARGIRWNYAGEDGLLGCAGI
jgi:hypothetical protein